MITSREILKSLKTTIEDAELFQTVRILNNEPVTGRLLDQLPDLTTFPACVLAAGSTSTLNSGCTGNTAVDVVVIASFFGGTDDESDAASSLLKSVATLLHCDGNAKVLSIGEVHYVFERMEDFHLTSEYLAWRIRLNAKFPLM